MTVQAIKGGQVPLKNVASFMTLVMRLVDREPHLPGFGVCFGPSGYGKSCSAIYAQNKTRAVNLEVGESWSRKTFLQKLLRELGIEPRGTIPDMADRAKEALGDDPRRPLIIDEADKLLSKSMIELVREIGDVAGCPVILIGEEALPTKLAAYERVHNRVLHWMQAQPCDEEDVAALATALYPKLVISADLLGDIRKDTRGRARRITKALSDISEFARNRGLTKVDRAAWGGQSFATWKAPEPRSAGVL